MNGAECLLRTLLANEVDLCLMNPGTSEMQFVSALDRVPRMRGVLGLFEGVCSGAADGYARMTGKPAATLLHLGPGLANALANLHNARKARSPVVNIVGEHSTQHLRHDAPLTADTAAFARPVSGWVRTVERAAAMGEAASAAVAAALGPPGQVASLIVPADFSWSEAGEPGCPVPRLSRLLPASERIRDAAGALRSGAAGLLLSGSALQVRGLRAAERVRAATGVRVFADRYAARMARGGDIPAVERIPYFPEPAQELLAGFERLILVEARPPVSFFGYPGLRSSLAPAGCAFDVLASEDQDGAGALEWLAEELAARPPGSAPPCPPRPVLPAGEPLSAAAVGRAVGALLPEGAIVSDESRFLQRADLAAPRAPPGTTIFPSRAARSARDCRWRWAPRWPAPAARWWRSKPTAAPCTPCNRSGPWRASGWTSPSSSWPTAVTASSISRCGGPAPARWGRAPAR